MEFQNSTATKLQLSTKPILEEAAEEEKKQSKIREFQLTQEQIDFLNSLLPRNFSIQLETPKVQKPSVRNGEKITKKIVRQSTNGEKVVEIASIPKSAAHIGTVSATKSQLSSNQVDQESQILSSENLNNNTNQVANKMGSVSTHVKKNLRENRGKLGSKSYYDYVQGNGSSSHSSQGNAAAQFMKKANEEMKMCMKMLNKLQAHKSAGPFLFPVDPVAQQCQNYFQIVKEPIDLSLVERNLIEGEYQTSTQFFADIKKIWSNSYLYNQKGSLIYKLTMDMDKYFKQLIQEYDGGLGIGGSLQGSASQNDEHPSMVLLKKQVDLLTEKIKEFNTTKRGGTGGSNGTSNKGGSGGSQKGKATGFNLQSSDLPMSLEEKRILGQHIRSLPAFFLKGVWEIVKEANMGTHGGEQLEFDINQLPNDVARQLDYYVQDKIAQVNQQQSKKQTMTFPQSSDNSSSTVSTAITNNNYSYLGTSLQEAQAKNFSSVNESTYNMAKDETVFQYNSGEFANSNSTQQIEVSALSETDGEENDSDSSLITDSGEVR